MVLPDNHQTASDSARLAVMRLVVVGLSAGLIATAQIIARDLPIGSVDGGWIYPYFRTFTPWLLLPILAAILFVPVLVACLRLPERLSWLAVAIVVTAGYLVQLALRIFALAPLGAIIRSDRANGFLGPAKRFDIGEFLNDHALIASRLPDHARTNMPGKFVLTKLLMLITTKPATIGLLVAFLSSLGAVAVYLVCRELTGDRRAGMFAMAIYLVLPGRIAFLPIMNTVTPGLALIAFWLFLRALRTGGMGASFGFGLALIALVFFEPLPIAMGFLYIVALWHYWPREKPTSVGPLALAAAAGFLAGYMTLRAAWSYDLLMNLEYVVRDANAFNQASRPYTPWLTANIVEFSLATGASTMAIAAGSFAWKQWRQLDVPVNAIGAATLGTVLILDVLGLNRGEVSRLWIFLGALVAVMAGGRLAASSSLKPFAAVFVGMALQTAVMCGMIGFVIP